MLAGQNQTKNYTGMQQYIDEVQALLAPHRQKKKDPQKFVNKVAAVVRKAYHLTRIGNEQPFMPAFSAEWVSLFHNDGNLAKKFIFNPRPVFFPDKLRSNNAVITQPNNPKIQKNNNIKFKFEKNEGKTFLIISDLKGDNASSVVSEGSNSNPLDFAENKGLVSNKEVEKSGGGGGSDSNKGGAIKAEAAGGGDLLTEIKVNYDNATQINDRYKNSDIQEAFKSLTSVFDYLLKNCTGTSNLMCISALYIFKIQYDLIINIVRILNFNDIELLIIEIKGIIRYYTDYYNEELRYYGTTVPNSTIDLKKDNILSSKQKLKTFTTFFNLELSKETTAAAVKLKSLQIIGIDLCKIERKLLENKISPD